MANGSYPFSRYPVIKDEDKLVMGQPLQDMDAERTVRRARRNRTCFTRQQVSILHQLLPPPLSGRGGGIVIGCICLSVYPCAQPESYALDLGHIRHKVRSNFGLKLHKDDLNQDLDHKFRITIIIIFTISACIAHKLLIGLKCKMEFTRGLFSLFLPL